MGSLLLNFLLLVPFSRGMKQALKVSYIVNRLDKYREEHMARVIAKTYKALGDHLMRTPNIIVIVHLWNAGRLKRMLQGLE